MPADPLATLADTLGRELAHPTRLRLLALYDAHPRLSPSEAANQLDETLGTVAYHVRGMHSAGLLAKAGTTQVRGAIQHFYTLSARGQRQREQLRKLLDQ